MKYLIIKKVGTIFTFTESSNGTLEDGVIYSGNNLSISGYNNEIYTNSADNKNSYLIADVKYKSVVYSSFTILFNELMIDGFTGNFKTAGATAYQLKDQIVTVLPATGELFTRYIIGQEEYYWNGTIFVKIEVKESGWASYADTLYTVASPFSIASGITSTIPNNGVTVINNQLPDGVTTFYNPSTQKITPQLNGDYYVITIRLKAKNTEVTGGFFDFSIDIGGALGLVFKESRLFVKGVSVEQDFVITCNGYVGATFLANGGIPKIKSGNGTTTIYNIEYQISRMHKAK